MQDWMDNNPDSGLSDYQFGFRPHRSTVDALFSVRNFIETAVYRGDVAIVVGLDISNAFNSIPWRIINDTLDARGSSMTRWIPVYLRRIIRSYLSDRVIDYRVRDGMCDSRLMSAGVPQASVLGLLLWNIAFDSVLRVEQEAGCRTVCYADDTLIVATAAGAFDAVMRANIMAARIVRRIKNLGLTIAAEKTEAVFFHGKRRKPRSMPVLCIDNTLITASSSIKYLGVVIDSSRSFLDHFNYIEAKAVKMSRALFCLMLNLRGPYENKRRLYASVLTSVVTYAAPVWCDALSRASPKTLQPIVRLQRSIAISHF